MSPKSRESRFGLRKGLAVIAVVYIIAWLLPSPPPRQDTAQRQVLLSERQEEESKAWLAKAQADPALLKAQQALKEAKTPGEAILAKLEVDKRKEEQLDEFERKVRFKARTMTPIWVVYQVVTYPFRKARIISGDWLDVLEYFEHANNKQRGVAVHTESALSPTDKAFQDADRSMEQWRKEHQQWREKHSAEQNAMEDDTVSEGASSSTNSESGSVSPDSSTEMPSPTSTDSTDEKIQKFQRYEQEYLQAQQAERDYVESIGGFRVRLNQEFQLGDYAYRITSVQSAKAVGPEFAREKASEGAWFILVNFLIRNDGKQTAETDANDVRLRDFEGREFSPDRRAAARVSSDFILRELHPGIFKKAITVFEVPDSVTRANFQILIPEKGLSKQDRKTAMLLLFPDSPKPSAAPKHTNKKRTVRRHNADEITSEQRELWRRMNRPWGTPWRSFAAPDEHGYPNN